MTNKLKNALFICSRNQWRSPTGEQIWRKADGVSVRSAGTSRNARRKVKHDDIRWAEIIFVMEDKHKSRLNAEFRDEIRYKEVVVLDIPDDYNYMDPELVQILLAKTEPYLD